MLHSHGPRHGPQSVEAALPRQDPNTSPAHLSPAYRVRVTYGLTTFLKQSKTEAGKTEAEHSAARFSVASSLSDLDVEIFISHCSYNTISITV